MELFQIKISNEGKIVEQKPGRLSLVDDDKNLLKTVREISDNSEEINISNSNTISTTSTSSSGGYVSNHSPSHSGLSPYSKNKVESNFVNYNNFSSPRNIVQGQNDSLRKGDEKAKLPFMRKNNATVEEAESTALSPLRKLKP